MLVGVGLDQPRIHGKPFSANQPGHDTGLHDTLEHPAEDAAIPEPLVARSRKYRVIGDLVLYAKLTEPAVGKVHLHLATQQTLGAKAKNIADDQHPQHQYRVDRRPTECRIVRRKFAVYPR